ncbi:MAG: cyanophycin synthetase [Candidatus Falkowbacteria bacterium]|nr:MAG: cyanophycin synthetase [Candidatus Falkowbacteria bacterium]
MKSSKLSSIVAPLFKKLAPRIGARVIIEPEWGIAGQIIFKNGKKRYFRYSSLDLNTLGASEIAKDKDYANFFMKKMGYPTIIGDTFFSDYWCEVIGSHKNIKAAEKYAKKIGFPLIAKPNSGSQGMNVIKVNNLAELKKALSKIFAHDNIALVQKIVSGHDYRLVVLDGKIISAYERLPFSVTGDGRTRVKDLIKAKLDYFIKIKRPARLKLEDKRLLNNLKLQKLKLNSVIKAGKKVVLLDNANLSTGGESIEVTEKIHPKFKKLAIKLTQDMGLRLCGVDLMIAGDISQDTKKYWVIEINSAPGLDHYIKMGAKQQKIVEKLYLQVLKSLAK